MKDVKAARAKGEELHKAGKHQESVDQLAKAMKILKIDAPAPAKSAASVQNRAPVKSPASATLRTSSATGVGSERISSAARRYARTT